MKKQFIVEIETRQFETEVEALPNNIYSIRVNDKIYEVDAQFINKSSLHLSINHHGYDVTLHAAPLLPTLEIALKERVYSLSVFSEQEYRLKTLASKENPEDSSSTITSPMPGKIVTLLVKEGEEVEQGQGLVVVEAMKMQNELLAPRKGRVNAIHVKEGQAVEVNALLLQLH